MGENENKVDQTEGDLVTGVAVVEGVLTFNRHDNSSVTYSFVDSLATVDPDVEGALWNDDGTIMLSGFTEVILGALPTSDPMVLGALWNDNSIIKLSAEDGP